MTIKKLFTIACLIGVYAPAELTTNTAADNNVPANSLTIAQRTVEKVLDVSTIKLTRIDITNGKDATTNTTQTMTDTERHSPYEIQDKEDLQKILNQKEDLQKILNFMILTGHNYVRLDTPQSQRITNRLYNLNEYTPETLDKHTVLLYMYTHDIQTIEI